MKLPYFRDFGSLHQIICQLIIINENYANSMLFLQKIEKIHQKRSKKLIVVAIENHCILKIEL